MGDGLGSTWGIWWALFGGERDGLVWGSISMRKGRELGVGLGLGDGEGGGDGAAILYIKQERPSGDVKALSHI